MRLTFTVVWKSWVSNKLRTALTVLGIALGVAVVTAIHVMDHNTIQSRLRELRPDSGRVDFELVPADASRDPVEVRARLRAVEGIGAVGLLHQARVGVRVVDEAGATRSVNAAAAFFGISPLPSAAFSHYVVERGEDLNDLDGEGAVLVGAELAASCGVDVGDTLEVNVPEVAPRALCKGGALVEAERIGGEAPRPRRVRIKGVLARHGLARRSFGQVVIGSFAVSRAFAAGNHSFFQVNRAYGADADRLRQELSGEFQVLDEHSALLGEAADERAFRNGVKVLGCLALVLGMFLVFQTLSQSLVERLRQVGLLRCLGASRGAVTSIFLLDAVSMAVVGTLLGSSLGLGLAALLQSRGFTTLGVGKQISGFEVPLGPVLWTAALGFGFTMTGAIFPLFKARRLRALDIVSARGLDGDKGADVMRGVNVFLFFLLVIVLPVAYLAMTPLLSESEEETRNVLQQLGGLILGFGTVLLLSPALVRGAARFVLAPWRGRFGLPVFLVERSLERNTGRYAASVCGLAVVLVAAIALRSITTALEGEIRQFGAQTTTGRLFLGAGGDKAGGPVSAAALREALADVDGIRDVEPHEGRRQVPYLLSGIDPERLCGPDGVLEGDPELATAFQTERSMVISQRLSRIYGLSAGDSHGVLTDEGRKPYRVLAVSDDAGFWIEERAWAVTSPIWMRKDFCVGVDCVEAVTLHLNDDANPYAVRDAVRTALPGFGRLRVGQSIVDYHLRDLDRDFILFDVLLGLILALAVMGLINQMTIAALSRVREFGVLRALGMSKRQLRQRFLVESLTVSALASGAAILLGLPLGYLVVQGLNQVAGLEAPYSVPWSSLGFVLIAALVIGAVAAVLPGLRAARLSPAESVRYE